MSLKHDSHRMCIRPSPDTCIVGKLIYPSLPEATTSMGLNLRQGYNDRFQIKLTRDLKSQSFESVAISTLIFNRLALDLELQFCWRSAISNRETVLRPQMAKIAGIRVSKRIAVLRACHPSEQMQDLHRKVNIIEEALQECRRDIERMKVAEVILNEFRSWTCKVFKVPLKDGPRMSAKFQYLAWITQSSRDHIG